MASKREKPEDIITKLRQGELQCRHPACTRDRLIVQGEVKTRCHALRRSGAPSPPGRSRIWVTVFLPLPPPQGRGPDTDWLRPERWPVRPLANLDNQFHASTDKRTNNW